MCATGISFISFIYLHYVILRIVYFVVRLVLLSFLHSAFTNVPSSWTVSSKQPLCVSACVFYFTVHYRASISSSCLLLLLSWLLVQLGILLRPQPLLLLLDLLPGVIDFGCQKRRSDMTLCNGLDPHHEKPAAVLWSQAVVWTTSFNESLSYAPFGSRKPATDLPLSSSYRATLRECTDVVKTPLKENYIQCGYVSCLCTAGRIYIHVKTSTFR